MTLEGGFQYTVVHIVSQESQAALIGSQVIDPLRIQAQVNGAKQPTRVIAVFLEAARLALQKELRKGIASFRARAPEITIILHPFVSRLGFRVNAWLLARRLRRMTRDQRVVFHCRGEAAVEWAMILQDYMRDSAIVADIRGAWPEEFLFARGFDGPDGADSDSRQGYATLSERIRAVIRRSARVMSVSPGMLSWLREQGASEEQLAYVPCCVRGVTFDASARDEMRATLGLHDQIVLTYIGTLGRYQHIEDGVVPFVREMMRIHSDVHFLALVTDAERLRRVLDAQGVLPERATILTVGQSEVARYLSAADAGLLLRAPSRMNRFSQPTKLGEYLAAGLPVVVSRGTGMVDQMVETNDAGFVVDVFGVPVSRVAAEADRVWRRLRARGAELRRNALALCDREFQWTSYTGRIRDAYTGALVSTLARPRHR